MIKSFKIKDKNNTIYSQISHLNLPDIEFKSGLNIIVGHNGIGKTTIMNALSHYTFCDKLGYSVILQSNNWLNDSILSSDIDKVNNIEIVNDYNKSTFKMLLFNELKNHEIMDNLSTVSMYISQKDISTGQRVNASIQLLFKIMFKEDHIEFDWINFDKEFKQIKTNNKSNHNIWDKRLLNLEQYVKNNHKDDIKPIHTVLTDEPDRNLDIDNLEQVYNVLNNTRPDTQVIAVINNPLMIYKLSFNKNINFIELSPDYVNSIINFVKQ
jgi:ABC-type cobalamin/Fe3+-siderophores transport system ATPase subunit